MKSKRGFFLASTVMTAAVLVVSSFPANAAPVDIRIGTIQPMSGAGFANFGIGLTNAAAFGAKTVTDAMNCSRCRRILQSCSSGRFS